MFALTWIDQFREIGIYMLVTNGAVILAFVLAYFVELRPLVRGKESGDPLAGACLERADANIRRFVWLYIGLQLVLTAVYMLFFQHRGIDDGYMLIVFFPSFLVAYSSFLFFRRDYYSRLKEVVTETGVPILVDLNRQILDKIFIWQLEVLSAIGIVVCGILYFDGDFSIAFLSVVLIMFYASIRTRKYMVREGFSYWYKALLFTNLFGQPAKLFEVVDEYRNVAESLSGSSTSLMIVAAVALLPALQLVLCLARLPTVWRSIRSVTRPA